MQYLREINAYNFTWTDPPSLNISSMKNNVSFCVLVHSLKGLAEFCGRKETWYLLSQVDSSSEYEVNITAVNAAGRGKISTIRLPGI